MESDDYIASRDWLKREREKAFASGKQSAYIEVLGFVVKAQRTRLLDELLELESKITELINN